MVTSSSTAESDRVPCCSGTRNTCVGTVYRGGKWAILMFQGNPDSLIVARVANVCDKAEYLLVVAHDEPCCCVTIHLGGKAEALQAAVSDNTTEGTIKPRACGQG